MGIDPDDVEDLCQLVHKGNIQIPLGVFNDFRRLRDFDTAGAVGAVFQDGVVKGVHQICRLRRGASCDLDRIFQRVEFVPGVDPLRAVPAEKVRIELEGTELFQHRHAIFFDTAGVNGAFVDDDIALLQYLSDGFTGAVKRRQVRAVVLVNGGGNGYDENGGIPDLLRIIGEGEACCRPELFRLAFLCGIDPVPEGVQTGFFDIESAGVIFFSESDRQRQPHISQPDHGDLQVIQVHTVILCCI